MDLLGFQGIDTAILPANLRMIETKLAFRPGNG
jgi:hypothetical protein